MTARVDEGVRLQGPRACKNCGAHLTGDFCSACGQKADIAIPSVWSVVADFLDDLYSFDSRLWRSLVPLVLRPGWLTLEYLRGRRVRYVPPLRMYLVMSVVFFLLVSVTRNWSLYVGDADAGAAVAEPGADAAAAEPGADDAQDDARLFCESDRFLLVIGSPRLRERLRISCRRIVADRGSSLLRTFAANVPIMLFVFIPLAAGYMKLLYPLARRRYVEHLLFLFHTHSFFFLVAISVLVAARISAVYPSMSVPAGLYMAAAYIYQAVYSYFAMRRVYADGRLLTLFKFCWLMFGYLVFLALTLILGFLYTALTL